MDQLFHDIRFGLRTLLKSPGFCVIAVLTLALGIGANTAMFSVVNAVLLTPMGTTDPDRAVVVWTENAQRDWHQLPASIPDYQDWRNSGVFSALAAAKDTGFNFRISDNSEHVDGMFATDEFFDAIGSHPALGRPFNPDEMQAGHNHVAILTDRFWHSRFAADPHVIGKTIVLDGEPHTVIGILPARFPRLGVEDIYTPLVFTPPAATDRGSRSFFVIGRLRPGVSLEAAQQRMSDLSRQIAQKFPEDDAGDVVRLQPMPQAFVEDSRILLLVLFGVVGFVLLIACANVANLLLVRGAGREREMAIRTALGAKPWALFRLLLTESVLLSLLGGATGVVFVVWVLHALSKFNLETVPNADLIAVNAKVLLFNVLLSIFTGILFGIAPAAHAWRSNLSDSLKTAVTTTAKKSHQRLRAAFVIGQVALTFILLAGAGLMVRSFLELRNADPGYNSHGALSMSITVSARQYNTPEKQNAFYDEVIRRIQTLPGVQQVGAVDALPASDTIHGTGLHFTDRPEPKPGDVPIIISDVVTPGYFAAMQIPLVRGRTFTDADRKNTPQVAIIDSWAANHYWPGQDPIGKRIKVEKTGQPIEIVGVVGEVKRPAIAFLPLAGQLYRPYAQASRADMSLVVRFDGPLAALTAATRKTINDLDIDQPIYRVQTLDAARTESAQQQQTASMLLSGFAGVGLLLAMIGIYGVVAYGANQRTREIGIRMALGAQRRDVLRLILGKGIVLTLIGAGLGIAAAFGLTRVLASLLRGVAATDALTFSLCALALIAMALLASYIPSRRATNVDPMVALRYE